MRRWCLCFALFLQAGGLLANEPLFEELPPGVFVQKTLVVPSDQTRAIGRKLGGEITRLTNSFLNVHGRSIQVNVIACANEAAAKGVLSGLLKIKPYPYTLRQKQVVIEYVGASLDETIALKTSWELGFVTKPKAVKYRVTAELATVERAHYMSANPLFNLFLKQRQGDSSAVAKIEELVAKFEFGSELALRKSLVAPAAATYSFTPKPQQQDDRGACVVSKFAQPPRRLGVPFVTATMEIAVDDTGFRPGQEPGAALTASTSFWPAADKEILALAQRITGDKKTAAAKVAAILAWTAPGKQITYGGQTGSRWGTAQVLAQKYGHCWDFSDCFVTLARAAGVPSRQVAGWLHGSSGHVWAEYYDAARRGWQQVDPTGGGQLACGIYHIPYFTSEAGEMPILYLAMPRIEVVATTGP